MKCEVVVAPDCEEKVVIYAREHSPLVEDICRLVDGSGMKLTGYGNREIVKLSPDEVAYVAVVGGKVFAVRGVEQFLIKERLYVLEEQLPSCFVKINQSCLANVKQVERFDTSLAGTLKIRFLNGDVDYVSRRQLKAVKERLGL